MASCSKLVYSASIIVLLVVVAFAKVPINHQSEFINMMHLFSVCDFLSQISAIDGVSTKFLAHVPHKFET